MESKGVFFEHLTYNDITIVSMRTASISDVHVDFQLDEEMYGERSFQSTFQAESIDLSLVSFRDLSFTFSINEFSLIV
jgi:hypothetical protein